MSTMAYQQTGTMITTEDIEMNSFVVVLYLVNPNNARAKPKPYMVTPNVEMDVAGRRYDMIY